MSTQTYAPNQLGSVVVDAPDQIIAGSMATIKVVYTAGKFGLDDQGGIRLLLRFANDFGRPQLDRPGAPNYVSAVASNGATLQTTYDSAGGTRPWFKAVTVRIVKQFLREGDTITVVLGDRSEGSAGLRIQTAAEPSFEIRVQANPFGTNLYGDVAGGKTIALIPGKPVLWKAIWPTLIRVGEPFRLAIKAEDACGNPTTATAHRLQLRASRPVHGMPEFVSIGANDHPFIIEGLSVAEPGDVALELRDETASTVGTANPARVVQASTFRHLWGDFHAQSEETIGTNTARDYFLFARDRALVDFVGHQGNDFQITNAFWQELNALTREFNDEGRFVTIPGYEWSGVTGLGGDRNVNFRREGAQIRRSSHALVEDVSDIATDCNHAGELFQALRDSGEECFAFAHIGGRYADLHVAHDGLIEKSVEIHSAWGTFEWLLYDAFDLGYRVGVVCNSDDHKGRPGASHPGASIFGAYGGLTCLLATDLTRDSIFEAVRRRHHYGTTGDRMVLSVDMAFDAEATLFDSDPALGPTPSHPVRQARMGDIVQVAPGAGARIRVSAAAASPLLKVELRIGKETVETIYPYTQKDLGRRLRVMWQGAEVRGRGRMSEWDGSLEVRGNAISAIQPFNFWHLEKSAALETPQRVSWQSVTTGNFAGIDLWLDDPRAGEIIIETKQGAVRAKIAEIDGTGDGTGQHLDLGGIDKRLSVFRLPDNGIAKNIDFERAITLRDAGDTPVYVCVTQENGHQAWSSPIYLFQ